MNRNIILTALGLGFILAFPKTTLGQDGKALIISPVDGATLDAMNENRVVYKVNPGPRGDHAHISVDNNDVVMLREVNGSYLLETLSQGKHRLCLKIVNKDHKPIGIEQCIQVKVE